MEDRFTWGKEVSITLKGKTSPVGASRALSHTAQRTPARQIDVPMTARYAEQAAFSEALENLISGRGAVIAVIGEPGIGKSRLVAECCRRFTDPSGGCMGMLAASASYGETTPFLPYRHLLLDWLKLPLDADETEIRRHLQQRGDQAAGRTGSFQDLLMIAGASSFEGSATPEAAKRRAFKAILRLFETISSRQPLIVELEDAHWSDQTSLELTHELALLTASMPILLVITSRPEEAISGFLAELSGDVGVSFRELDSIPWRERMRGPAFASCCAVPYCRKLWPNVCSTSAAATPSFSKSKSTVLGWAGALVPSGEGWRFEREVPFEVAPTVQHSLLASIDRLQEHSHDVLLAASVVGERFDRETLDVLVGAGAGASIDDLVRERVIIPVEGTPGTYRFRHALMREAAYASLPRRERQVRHAAAANALKSRYSGREADVAARLGRHLAIAGQHRDAVEMLTLASRNALSTFANPEAARLAAEALAIVNSETDTSFPERRRVGRELSMLAASALRRQACNREAFDVLKQGLPLHTQDRPAERAEMRCVMGEILRDDQRFAEALREFDRAEACLVDGLESQAEFNAWLDIQLGRAGVFYWLGETARIDAVLEQITARVSMIGDIDQRVHYLDAITVAMLRPDRYSPSDALLRHSAAAYVASQQSDNDSTRAWGVFLRGFTLLCKRELGTASDLLQESLQASERLGDVLLRARCLAYLMVTSRLTGAVDETTELIAEAQDAASEAGLDEYLAMATATESWVRYRMGDHAAALELATKALTGWQVLPHRYFYDWMASLQLLAIALDRGDFDAAVAAADTMLSEGQQQLPPDVESLLVAGTSLQDVGDGSVALGHLRAALASARGIGLI